MALGPRQVVLMLLCVALVARLGFLIGVVGLDAPLRGDEINYQDHATSLAAGRGFVGADGHPTAARPPVLPLVLAGLYRIFGVQIGVARIFEILLGVALVGLTYMLASRFLSPGGALLAGALTAVNPYLIFISSYLLTENLYTVFLILFLLVWVGGRRRFGNPELLAAGLLLGLASLTRPNAVFLACFAVPAILIWAPGAIIIRVARSAVFCLAIAAAIMPWAARNHAKLGSWILFTTHGGITFYQGNNRLVCDVPNFYGSVAPRESLPGWMTIRASGEVEGDRQAWKLAKEFLRDNPRLIPKMVVERFLRFWRLRSHAASSGVRSGWWWNKNKILGSLASRFDFGICYAGLVFPFALLGLVVTARAYRDLYIVYAVILVHVLVALAFYGSLRARVPIEPLIAIFASAGVAFAVAWVRRRGERR